jgi:hypothetical protein
MNLKIFIVIISLLAISQTQAITLESDGLKAVFNADWLQDSQALNEYIPKYK